MPRAARLVDIAPTICRAARLRAAARRRPTYLAVQDGEVRDRRARPRVGTAAARGRRSCSTAPTRTCSTTWPRRGEAPNVARLIEMGIAFGHGAMASLPTVTLANHTSIITGAHPGHHGILNNAWFDRATRRAGHHQLAGHVAVEHEAPRARASSRSTTPCTAPGPTRSPRRCNEPCDIGADYSTFDFFRRGEVPPIPKDPFGLPHTTERFVRPSKDYSWSSVVDHMGVDQAVGILGGHYRDAAYPLPALHVVQLHAHRRRDARGRPALRDGGRVGARQRRPHRRGPRRGRAGRRVRRHAFVLVADHGMEENDPTCTATGTCRSGRPASPRDEAYGFLYLGVS